jgi:hypothetical protein
MNNPEIYSDKWKLQVNRRVRRLLDKEKSKRVNLELNQMAQSLRAKIISVECEIEDCERTLRKTDITKRIKEDFTEFLMRLRQKREDLKKELKAELKILEEKKQEINKLPLNDIMNTYNKRYRIGKK